MPFFFREDKDGSFCQIYAIRPPNNALHSPHPTLIFQNVLPTRAASAHPALGDSAEQGRRKLTQAWKGMFDTEKVRAVKRERAGEGGLFLAPGQSTARVEGKIAEQECGRRTACTLRDGSQSLSGEDASSLVTARSTWDLLTHSPHLPTLSPSLQSQRTRPLSSKKGLATLRTC